MISKTVIRITFDDDTSEVFVTGSDSPVKVMEAWNTVNTETGQVEYTISGDPKWINGLDQLEESGKYRG